ncbi:DUF3396 domain-containing protein [Myxococcota bacterium]|nr:DUF3396 domain-containing protein [Myxococcota bacterium]
MSMSVWSPSERFGLSASDLRAADSEGLVLCELGLVATFYIERGDRPEVRAQILRAFHDLERECGRPMTWFADPETGAPTPTKGEPLADPSRWPARIFDFFDFQMVFHAGKEAEDASACFFLAVSREEEDGQLSYVSLGLPLEWIAKNSPDAAVRWVLALCEHLQPSHGLVGLAPIAHPAGVDDASVEAMFRLVRLYPGLEFDQPHHHAEYLSTQQRIKGVNWLTFLAHPWVKKLGGRSALIEALGQEAGVYEWGDVEGGGGGLLLRAGGAPVIGGAGREHELHSYRKVASVLRPIRTLDPAVVWPQGLGGVSYNEAIEWMRRLD